MMISDKTPPLPERVAQALAGLGVPAQCRPAAAGACTLRVGSKGQWAEYRAVVAPGLARATLGAGLMQARHVAQETGLPTVLLAEHVTPPLAEDLRAQGQPFADAVGNAWLPEPTVLVTGRKPQAKAVLPADGRADTPAGLKILFALLCQPELAMGTHRAIASAAGVALGSVPAVLEDLRQQGAVSVMGKQRRLEASRRLLDRWAQAYARRLRPKTLKGLYTTPLFDTWAEWGLQPSDGLWGGEPAASLLTQYLRPGVLTIYSAKLAGIFMARQRMSLARAAVDDRVVEYRQPFWGELPPGPLSNATLPVLVYADLLATGDGRCIETAQVLYDQYLAATFK